MKPSEIRQVEDLVNAQIRRNPLPIETKLKTLTRAKAKGAKAPPRNMTNVRSLSIAISLPNWCGGTTPVVPVISVYSSIILSPAIAAGIRSALRR